MLTFLSLVFGTLISEDLACVAAGLLIQRGQVEASSAVVACTLGIFAGDVGLWTLGRTCGRAVLAWPRVARRLQPNRFHECRMWLDRHAGWAIVASRFLPGSRLPLYVIAGIVELPGIVFAGWALLGTLLWTPALVLLTAIIGDAFIGPIASLIGSVWKADILAAVVIVVFLRSIRAKRSQAPVLADCSNVI
jgi:membrane protein DedA with SNARE-associated domain